MRDQPKNLVTYDESKRSSIRTYNNNKPQGFSIGWDVDQSSKNDTKIAGKVGQAAKNSYIPAYVAQTYQQPQNDDEYLRQLYLKEQLQKQQLQQNTKQPAYERAITPPKYETDEDLYLKYQQRQTSGAKDQYSPYKDEPKYQPSYIQQPAYQQPSYQQPSYQQPSYQPSYQQPQYSQPLGYQNGEAKQYTNAELQQQEDALSQFSQNHPLQTHKVAARKNQSSNIFNTDIAQDDQLSRSSNRPTLKKKEFDDSHHKGYGSFYKTDNYQPAQVANFNPQNRNKQNNQIFPQY